MYKLFRYFVFGLFVICNVIIATSAVWNLSLVQDLGHDFSAAKGSNVYSICVGCIGLIFIFPIFFCEIANKETFLTKVWFELPWVAVFCIMELVGAAVATAVGQDLLCQPLGAFDNPNAHPRCTSSRLLQGFSWMCSLALLCYFLMLIIFTLLKAREDPTIWHCHVRKFPWDDDHLRLASSPCSPSGGVARKVSKMSLPRFRSKPPTIAAPRPRRAVNNEVIREAILSYRSGLSLEYEIEHFQQQTRPTPRPELGMAMVDQSQRPLVSIQHSTSNGQSFYPEHMRMALANMAEKSPDSQTPSNPLPPSPNPIGNWPQMNPPLRRLGEKRKTQQNLSSPSRPGGDNSSRQDSSLARPPQAHLPSPSHRTRPSGPRRSSRVHDFTTTTTTTTTTAPIADDLNFVAGRTL